MAELQKANFDCGASVWDRFSDRMRLPIAKQLTGQYYLCRGCNKT